MVTPVQNSNTVAFPAPANASKRKRTIKIDSHTVLRLQLSNVLQTTLELPQVLQLFFDEIQQNLPLAIINRFKFIDIDNQNG